MRNNYAKTGWEYYGKSDELRENVAKEELELAVQPAPEHDRSDSHLEDGMRDPERVIENFDFLVHLLSLVGKATLNGRTGRPRSSASATLAFSNPMLNVLR